MVFIYYSQGVAPLYTDYCERLLSQLALRGTEITELDRSNTSARMRVQHMGEKGELTLDPEGKNIKATYNVTRERKEVTKGLRGGVIGAVTGAGIGSILGGVLRGEQSVGDALGGAIGGAAAGGTYGAYEGYEESRENRTQFATVLAETMRDVEETLQSILQGQEEAREVLRERGRQKREADLGREQEMRDLLDELYGDLLAAQEEVNMAESEGANVTRTRGGIERAEALYLEADAAWSEADYTKVKAKVKASRSMIDKTIEALAEE